MSVERRRRLLERADEWDFMVLEDNVYGPLRFEGEPLPSLLSPDSSGRVLKADTFTKIVAPALRLGWVTGHPRRRRGALGRPRRPRGQPVDRADHG